MCHQPSIRIAGGVAARRGGGGAEAARRSGWVDLSASDRSSLGLVAPPPYAGSLVREDVEDHPRRLSGASQILPSRGGVVPALLEPHTLPIPKAGSEPRRGDAMPALTFDSVAEGDALPEVARTVDQETFWKFAVASFDYNPVHCDPEWVRTARPFTLTTTVGHGMMTAAFMSSVVTEWMLPTVLLIRRATIKLTFPVLPGWTVHSRGYIAEKHVITPGENFVVIKVKATNQDDMVVGLAEYEVVFPD
jgi:acyl dehydratase